MAKSLPDPIPRQRIGSRSDTTEERRFATAELSRVFFETVKKRLLDVNHWDKLCRGVTAEFALTDSRGNKVTRSPQEGDHFMIDIPGPGSKTGDGYDWVRVGEISHEKKHESDTEQLSITVHPATNPQNNDPGAAHFFNEKASSTFLVIREKNIIRAEVHGRNELPNMRPQNLLDRVRNAIIAFGATIGMSSTQWKKLVKGLVRREE